MNIPIPDLFPKINNLKAIIKAHPDYHPDSKKYLDYWREEKKRCIEGYWYEDLPSQYRYCPPNLYFYANMGMIVETDHNTKARKKTRPFIRDVEWIIYTAYLACRGFSGFEDDPEFTSSLAVKEENEEAYTKNCYINNNPKSGKLKTYVAPVEYLKRLHDKPLGRPLYENDALNLFLLGSRGLGKSYTIGHAVLHELLFDGAKYYTKDAITNPNKVEIFVGSFKADKSSELLSKVQMALNELPGSFGKADNYRPSPFYKEMSGTLKVGNTKSPFEHLYKKKENGNWVTAGTGSKILHEIFTVENPQSAAGSRTSLLVIEEVALLPNLKDVHGANIPTQITEGRKFGTSVYIGTGGNMDKIVESEYIYRRPKEYNFLAFEDTLENTGEMGLFLPVQYTYNDLKDENGNTIFELANKRVINERKNKKWDALQHQKTNFPIIPSEMFMSDKTNIFPIYEIQKQLKYIITNQKRIDNFTNYGNLIYDMDAPNGVSFVPDTDSSAFPINDFPTKKGTNLRGAITIYEHPPEVIPKGLYKVCYDPVKDENIETMSKGVSLAAIYVYKTIQRFDGVFDQIVAHYVGRISNTDEIHDIALKLAQYYGTKVFVEMNLPGFYKYCIHTKKLRMLEPTPMLTIGKVAPTGKQRYNVGMYMSETLKIQGEQYLNRWLLQIRDVEYDEIGNIIREKRNIDYIYDKAFLEELIHYNRVINTDRVSAFLLLMYLIEESKEKPTITEDRQDNAVEMVKFLKQNFTKKQSTQSINKHRTINFPTLYG